MQTYYDFFFFLNANLYYSRFFVAQFSARACAVEVLRVVKCDDQKGGGHVVQRRRLTGHPLMSRLRETPVFLLRRSINGA